jgi:putative ABC transport system permease protein
VTERKRFENDLNSELRFHVEARIQELIAAGMIEDEARRKAAIEFGGMEGIKEECREVRSIVALEQALKDLRFAWRALAGKPLFAAAMVVTLAIGIGANTAIFSIVDAVVLRPLPYKSPDRLVAIWGELRQQPGSKVFLSFADFLLLQKESKTYEAVAAETWAFTPGATVIWRGEPYRASAFPVTEGIFSLLGIPALRGRTFKPEDTKNSCTTVLSHQFWNNQLGGSPDIIGGNLRVDDKSCLVAGVMPSHFEFFPRQAEMWTLITPDSPIAKPESGVAIFARLKEGVRKEDAQAEVNSLHETASASVPVESWVRRVVPIVYPLQDEFTWLAGRNLRKGLTVLLVAAGMLLLIACVNIGGLLMGKAMERQKELAVRAALGCGRSRIIRQLLMESALIAVAGAFVGTIGAFWLVRYFRSINPIDLPPGNPVTVNVKASQADLNQTIKATSSRLITSWWNSKTCRLLLIAQVALSMTLIVGASLLVQSVARVQLAPLGFQSDHLLAARITLPANSYLEQSQRASFYSRLVDRIGSVSGVQSVALSSQEPLGGVSSSAVTVADGSSPETEVGNVGTEQVSSGFFTSMGIPFLQGRPFDARDNETAIEVAIVNQRFVEQYFSNKDPIGRQFKIGPRDSPNPWLTVIGVVGNVSRMGFQEMGYEFNPLVYRPLTQRSGDSMTMLVRTLGDSINITSVLQREVKALDSRIPVYASKTIDDIISRNLSHAWFRGIILSTFALFAVLLAAVGVYGVFTQNVLQRSHEIGLRIAIGAQRRHIVNVLLGQALILSATGIAIGIVATLWLGHFISGMLYGVAPTDSRTVSTTAAGLFGVVFLATYFPARRAMKIDPMVVLRNE